MREARKGFVMANKGWRSDVMDYDAALRYAETLYKLGNYALWVVKVK